MGLPATKTESGFSVLACIIVSDRYTLKNAGFAFYFVTLERNSLTSFF